jgi:hypothetical protein
MRLWRVTTDDRSPTGSDEVSWYYSDVIGAETALEAVRRYVANKKVQIAEDLVMWRDVYGTMVRDGRMTTDANGEYIPFERWHEPDPLPQRCVVVPMRDTSKLHIMSVSSDRKYESEAFNSLWNWEAMEAVRL